MIRNRCLINLFNIKCSLVKLHHKKCNFVLVRRNLYQLQSLRLSSVLYRLATKPRTSIALSAKMAATWSMGPGTLDVPLSLFAKNRNRLADKLKSGQVVVLQGGEDISHYDTDIEYVFRQASLFILKVSNAYPLLLIWICPCFNQLPLNARLNWPT